MKRDHIPTQMIEPAHAVAAAMDELVAHRERLATLNAGVADYNTKIAATEADIAAPEPLRARLAEMKAAQRAEAGARYLGEPVTQFTDNKAIAAIERELQEKEAAAEGAAAAREVLVQRRDALAAEQAAEASKGKALRRAVLDAQIQIELANLKRSHMMFATSEARVAGAILAADSFSDPANGLPRVFPQNFTVVSIPSLPECALPALSSGDRARAAVLKSYEIDIEPLAWAAANEFLATVE
jgi:hypothetical protein